MLLRLLVLTAALGLLAGCGETAGPDLGMRLDDGPLPMVDDGPRRDAGPPDLGVDPGPPRALFALPEAGAEATLFDVPWPNDLLRGEDGRISLHGFPNPRGNALVEQYIEQMEAGLDGWANNGAIYFRFSRAVDELTLPANATVTLEPGAAVFLVDVETGERHPMVVHYQEEATLFWPARTLAMRPVYGLPLAGGRQYVAVVTDRVRFRGAGDGIFGRDEDFAALFSGVDDPEVQAARDVYRAAFETLEEGGVDLTEVLVAAVFTTQEPTAPLRRARDWLVAEGNYPVPAADAEAWEVTLRSSERLELEGSYGPSPTFQAGTLPYLETEDGGALAFDDDGDPVVQGDFDARFSLTVPTTAMPEGGYPLVLYAHGTGGDFRTVIDNGVAADLAERGIATMGVDQLHHGDRNPTATDPAILFYNIVNPAAARDNVRQSALDVVQQARLVPGLTVPLGLGDRDGEAIRFGPVLFFGHSQGGQNGPLYLAVDDSARAAVLSAASAVITHTLIEKLEPANPVAIPDLVRITLGLPGTNVEDAFARESFVLEHPIATLLQTWVEAGDPSNYGRRLGAGRPEGFSPLSVLMTEGLTDQFSPPRGIEALAGSIGLPIVGPVARAVESLGLLGIEAEGLPVSGNLADGATGGLLQFPGQGHFVLFRDAGARRQAMSFLESAASGGPGTILDRE